MTFTHGAHSLGPGGEQDADGNDPCCAAKHGSDEFRMFHFKVLPCCNTASHDWLECVYSHVGEKATRRCPKTYSYTAVACPDVRKAGRCPRGDACPYAHSTFEYWLHPTRYRTQLCSFGASCRRSVCFFAHSMAELRIPTLADGTPTAPLPSGPSSTSSSTFTMIMQQEQQHKQTQLQQQLQRLLVSPGLDAAGLMAPPPVMAPLHTTPPLPAPAFADLLAMHQQQQKQQQLWGQDAQQQRDQAALMAKLANGLRLLEQSKVASMQQQEQEQSCMPANIWAPGSPATPPAYLPQDNTVLQLAAAMASSHISAQSAAAQQAHEQQQMCQQDHISHMFRSGSPGMDLQDSLMRALSGISAGSSSSGGSNNGDGSSFSSNSSSNGSDVSSSYTQPAYARNHAAAAYAAHAQQMPQQQPYLPPSFFVASPYTKPSAYAQQPTGMLGGGSPAYYL